tara:strand:- start:44656 stop:45615 length:960 start_codon:yes stop_codon:yes gene_type:complete
MPDFRERIEHIMKKGVATNNRFQVIIPIPQSIISRINELENIPERRDSGSPSPSSPIDAVKTFFVPEDKSQKNMAKALDLMIDETPLPSKNLATTEIRYNGDFYKIPYATLYEEQEFSFLCSRDMFEKMIIDMWMDFIFDPIKHEISYMDEYSTDITLNLLDEQDNVTYSVVFRDAFPITCNSIPLSNQTRDEFANVSTAFAFKRWENANNNITIDDGVNSLSQTPLGPLVTPILANPAVQEALSVFEDTTGIDLDGEAANIYNMIDDVIKGATGTSTNKLASLLNSFKFDINQNGKLSSQDQGNLIKLVDNAIDKLKG